MSKLKKFFIVFGGLWVLTGLALVFAWYGPLPKLDWTVNRAFMKVLLESPEGLSSLRILEPAGIRFHQDDLDDASMEAGDRSLAQMNAIAAEIRSFEGSDFNYQEALTYDIVAWMLERLEAGADKWRFHGYPVNQLFGIQSGFPTFMESVHAVKDETDAANYITRLTRVKLKFEQVLEGLKHRESLKIIPPTFVVDKVLEEMKGFIGAPVEENILYASLKTKLEESKFSEDRQAFYLGEAKTVIESSVFDAYRILIDYFEALKPKTDTRNGVWKLPEGDEYYRFTLQMFTTSEMSPDEIHATGVAEVERIQNEILEILKAEGYDTEKPVGELLKGLSEEERFLYPETDEGRAQVLEDYRKIITEISTGLDDWFSVQPQAGVEVERIPEFKEKTSPGAYYNGPAMDGSRPGVFYANLYDLKATPKYDMRTLAYHEAIPGHHFQIAIAQEQEGLPLIRRMAPFTAYTEGWALYSERVAWEAGFQKDPYDNIGRLRAELFRAVRLVVDTGIHAKRWTREEAIDYMSKMTGNAESDVIAEIERYIVMPGQACAYKVGMMEIMAIRADAEKRLGERFDIKAFHDVVLRNGAMPLAILRRVVDDWVKEVEAQS